MVLGGLRDQTGIDNTGTDNTGTSCTDVFATYLYFCLAFFIFFNILWTFLLFLRRKMTCFAGVWTT